MHRTWRRWSAPSSSKPRCCRSSPVSARSRQGGRDRCPTRMSPSVSSPSDSPEASMTTTRPLPTLDSVDLATWVPESDSPVWEQFTVYTSANIGEDLPRVITPLTADIQRWIIGHGFFNLQRNLGTLGPLGLDFNEFHHAGIGVFYGRAHLTLGFIRAFADLLPGTDADAVDEQYLGKKRAPGQPPKAKTLDQVLFSLTAYPRFMRILKQAPTLTQQNDARVNQYIHREIARDLTAFDKAGLWAKVLESIQWQEYAFDLHMYNNPAISSA